MDKITVAELAELTAVYPGGASFPLAERIHARPLEEVLNRLRRIG